AACAVVLVGVVGCSDAADPAKDDPSPTPRDRIEYASQDIPEDRAADAVESALGRLDACALIDPRGVDVKRFSASSELEAQSPHSCAVTNGEYEDVSVTLGVELSTEDRFTNKVTSLGGAKAYILGADKNTFCRVALPVSFTHTIEFRGSSSGVDSHACATVKSFAAAAAERLDDPDSVELGRDRARQTACNILRPAIDLKRGTEIRYGSDFLSGMDRCEAWESPKADDMFVPVSPNAYLSIEYGEPTADYYEEDFGTIAGRQIHGDSSAGCVLAWDERKPPSSVADGDVAQFRVSSTSCKKSERLVSDITTVIDQDRVKSSGAPQRPVLYEPDEADSPAVGACADISTFEESDCEPYADADAPSTGEQTIDEAAADPNVNCAIAQDAVQEHFGADMRPVTAVYGADASGKPRYACGFVEESHALQVWVVASEDPMNQTPGSEIDGHPTHDVTTVSEGTRQMWVALDDPERPGHLFAEVRVLPSRDHGMYSDSPVNEKPLEKLDEAMTDIVSAHFS
ncbi:MAG: hypothetical protein L0K86_28805, partial [Actinomycetia bacterium]|nr:hypothetical protein [Actinomycetes bacterium]